MLSTTTDTPVERATASPDGLRRQTVVLAILVTFQLMVATDLTVANIALPGIQESLGFSTVNLAWVINAYTLAFGGLMLLGGRIGDILGRRRVFVGGTVLFTVSSLLAGMATSSTWLLSARVGQGIGSALAAPAALALVTSNFPEGAPRRRATGLYAASGALGASVGLILGGVLTDWASWRWVLWINVPFGILIAVITPRFVRDGARKPGGLDLAGSLTSTLGVSALVYGTIRASTEGWSDQWSAGSLLLAVLLLALFVLVEIRSDEPVIPLRLFAHRTRNLAYVITMLLVATVFGAFFFLTQFFQEVLGYSPLRTGFAFLPMTGAVMLLSGVASRLTGTAGPRTVISGGVGLILVGAFWISQVTSSAGYLPNLVGPLLLLGIGMSGVIGPLTVVAMSEVDDGDGGAASGLFQVMQQFGISIGLAVLVTVFGAASRRAAEGSVDMTAVDAAAHSMAEGLGSAYVLATGFAVVALALALALPPGRRV